MAFTDPNAPIVAREFATATDGTRIDINGTAYPAAIALYSGNILEITPALVRTVTDTTLFGELQIYGPVLANGIGGTYAFLILDGYADGHCSASMQADDIQVKATHSLKLIGADTTSPVQIGDGTKYVLITGDALQAASANITGVLQAGTLQTNVIKTSEVPTAPSFATGWTNASGTFGGVTYYKTPDGYVTIEGACTGGTGGIFTLPVGYRPPQDMGFAVSGNNAFARITVSASTGNVSLVVGAATTGLHFGGIKFRTF